MRTDQFHYHLPLELIAQTPAPRGESRLLVLDRHTGAIQHGRFADLLHYLNAGDMLVLNDTRVTARRLTAIRPGGEPAEILLLRPVRDRHWEALVRPGKGLKPGRTIQLIGPPPDHARINATVLETTDDGGRIIELPDPALRDEIATWGAAPLPPYIETQLPAEQENRYQTVYARHDGSAAAPTAGLHFTPELLNAAARAGVEQAYVTLHVGIDTFRPVRTTDIGTHQMHGEMAVLSSEEATRINRTSGRIVAVGTTSVRVLESAGAARSAGATDTARVVPYFGVTRLFISPGYSFQVVDAMITNFHLPCSTLLMLVSAFGGYDAVMHAYNEAVRLRYRFFSFGDAMLIA